MQDQNAPHFGAGIGSGVSAALQGFDATPPPTASDASYAPGDQVEGTIAGQPSTFVAHGVNVNDLGSFPGGARASQITPDLTGPQIVNPARTGDGYRLLGAGTPELVQGQPKQGSILDKLDAYGVMHLGVGPGIPLVLLVVIGAVFLWTRTSSSRRPSLAG
jgi:hypothetical protein